MVTMRDAVKAYDQHYYGGKGMDILYDLTGVRIRNPQWHDVFHVIVSGIQNMDEKDGDLKRRFEILDESGLTYKNVGVKAELLQHIYLLTFDDSSKSDNLYLDEYLEGSVASIFDRYIDKVDYGESKKNYSHIPQLNSLITSYKNIDFNHCRVSDFISDVELKFHIEKAKQLHDRLAEKHPDWFNGDGRFFIEKMLDADLNEFRIDNFTAVEKGLLRDAGKSASSDIRI